MLGRLVIISATVLALGTSTALAGQYWILKRQCENAPGLIKQCAFQFVTGNHNTAVTKQTTEQTSFTSSLQFSYTKQTGNDNNAYTEQTGTNQTAKTIQNGDGNFSGTYQEGENQKSKTIENSNEAWAATSSIGSGTETSVVITTW